MRTRQTQDDAVDKPTKSVISFNGEDKNGSHPASVTNARTQAQAKYKPISDAGSQTKLFVRAQDKEPRVMVQDVIEVMRKEEEKKKIEVKGAGIQTACNPEKEQATQFPEEITRVEADKMWF